MFVENIIPIGIMFVKNIVPTGIKMVPVDNRPSWDEHNSEWVKIDLLDNPDQVYSHATSVQKYVCMFVNYYYYLCFNFPCDASFRLKIF